MSDEELQNALMMLPKTFNKQLLMSDEPNGTRGYRNNIMTVCINKEYEKVKSPQVGDVVIDAGAYIGLFTGKSSLQVGDRGKVYAFEPEPENFSHLRENTKGLKNVEIFNRALWSSEKDLILFVRQHHSSGHSLIDWVDANKIKERLPVHTTYLDNVVKGKVDFIKLDAEGAELEILHGATRILKQYKPFVVCEIHSKNLLHQIISFMLTYNYKHVGSDGIGVHAFW